MMEALQHAKGVANGVQAKLAAAASELNTLVIQEAPSKALRTLGLAPGTAGTTAPTSLDGNGNPLTTALLIENGIPSTTTTPDGKVTTITPNPDGTTTVAQSVQGPDGSTVTTSTTGDGPPTTTVTKTRPDGSGIIDTTVTGADGKQQQFQKVPEGNGRTATYAVNADGSRGAKIADSYSQNGGTTTDMYGQNGVIDRQWQRPDGFRSFEQYVPGPDGQPHLAGTSNSAGMRSEMGTDGTINTTYPDGRTAQTTQLADGRVVTKFQDGSVLEYDPSQAPPGAPKQTIWDNVKSWSGTQWNSLADSTQGLSSSIPSPLR